MTAKIVLFEYKGVTEAVTSQDQDELLSITCGVYMFGRTPTPSPLPTLTKKYRKTPCIYTFLFRGRKKKLSVLLKGFKHVLSLSLKRVYL